MILGLLTFTKELEPVEIKEVTLTTGVTVQKSKTPEELYNCHMQLWADQNPANLYFIEEDHPDYWNPFTDEFVELTKAKTVRL